MLCVPYGMPRMMAVATYPVEILQTPGQITIVTEAFSEVRRVFMDQPQLPIDEVPPGYYGHSVGRWEGDTLVIDTVGIKESVPGYQNIPHSDQMRITERHPAGDAGRPARPDHHRRSGRAREAGRLHAGLSPDAAATRWWSSCARTIASTSTSRGSVRMRLDGGGRYGSK